MVSLDRFQKIAEKYDRSVEIAIQIEHGALTNLSGFLKNNSFNRPAIVADQNTYEAAGKKIRDELTSDGIKPSCHILKANSNGQVIADEKTLVQLFVEISDETDVMVAVGSGTIHDIVRFVSCKMKKPIISVPTAASVDGYTSRGAPLILRGMKQTIQTSPPIAVFADLNVLTRAPKEMTAAGFGDILAKYTSLLDWKISSLIGGEPYDENAAEITKRSLTTCVSHVEDIANQDSKGIRILMHSLIESGLIMLILGHSRPASGGEHHLSHYWEIDSLKNNRPQHLHGAKVGVSTVIITDLYKKMFAQDIPKTWSERSNYGQRLARNIKKIQRLIEELPDPDQLKKLINTLGGPSTPQELGIEDDLVEGSLNQAFHLRDRCTGLFLINQFKSNDLVFPFHKKA